MEKQRKKLYIKQKKKEEHEYIIKYDKEYFTYFQVRL